MDATFVEVPKLCPSREEHAPIKVGERPTGWKVNQARQQNVDARWAKKHEETHYGYQNPVKADEANQLRQDYVVTPAAVLTVRSWTNSLTTRHRRMVPSGRSWPPVLTVRWNEKKH